MEGGDLPPPQPPPNAFDNAPGGGGPRDVGRGRGGAGEGGVDVEVGGGAADASELDRHSEISVNRGTGSMNGVAVMPLHLIDGLSPAGVCEVSAAAAAEVEVLERCLAPLRPRASPKVGGRES